MKKTVIVKYVLKYVLIIVAAIFIVSFANAYKKAIDVSSVAETQEDVFQFGIPEWLVWEMKEGEVRQHLNEDLKEYGNIVYFTHDEEYKKCRIMETYGFTDENQLIHLSYSFSDSVFNDDKNAYYEIYTECKEKLKNIYGAPVGESEEWKNEHYKNDEYMKYKAIEDGDYVAMTAWNLEDHICYIQIDKGVEINYEAKKK